MGGIVAGEACPREATRDGMQIPRRLTRRAPDAAAAAAKLIRSARVPVRTHRAGRGDAAGMNAIASGHDEASARLAPGPGHRLCSSVHQYSQTDRMNRTTIVALRVTDLRAEFEAELRAVARLEEQLQSPTTAKAMRAAIWTGGSCVR